MLQILAALRHSRGHTLRTDPDGVAFVAVGGDKTDIRNAGAEWVDEAVVIDGKLAKSRKSDDLPAFKGALIDVIAKSRGKTHA